MLVEGGAIFTSSDRDYKQYLAINASVSPFVLPYKAHYRLDDFAWMSLSELSDGTKPRPKPRTHDLMFHGSTTRGTR